MIPRTARRLRRRPLRRRRPVRLRTSLLVSVMLPVLALTALGGYDAVRRHQQATAASAVLVQVLRLEKVLQLDIALSSEDVASEFFVVSAAYGLTPAEATRLLGLDTVGRLQAAQSALDAAMAVLPAGPLHAPMTDLTALRARVGGHTATEDQVRSFFEGWRAIVEQVWLSDIATLGRITSVTAGSGSVVETATALRDAHEGLTAGTGETPAAASLAFPGLPGQATARQDLAVSYALYSRATAGLGAELGPEGAAAWQKLIIDDPDVKAFQAFVTGLLQTPADSAVQVNVANVALAFHSGLVRDDRLRSVVEAASSDVTRSARVLGDNAQKAFQEFLLGLAMLMVLSVALVAATARAIVRPLRRLADRAGEVGSGVIDGEPLTVSGPLELSVVTEAFNETVANLRAVGAATLALAAADFDSPVLRTSVPGPIGESLRNSVTRLSQSIQDNEQLHHTLARNEKRFRVIFESNPVPMWVYDAEKFAFLEVNRAATRAYGYDHAEFMNMRTSDIQPVGDLTRVASEGGPAPAQRDGVWQHRTRSGQIIEVNVTTQALDFAERPAVLVMAVDITARLADERTLVYQATHDALTGLPNRVLLLDRLEQAIARADRSQGDIGVVFVDLDRFKVVNDAKGHTTGDEVLVHVATRIRGAIRPADTVARFGGDEFVVILEGIDGSTEALAICDRISVCLEAPFDTDGSDLVVSASQGIVIARAGDTAEDLLRTADAAMYWAKEHGRSRTAVADDAMSTRASRRLQVEADMRRGLDAGEFVVYYQPIVSLADGAIIGAEALARWADPTRGMILPDLFIPIAEETGLILRLGEQVLAQALHEAARWPAPLDDGPRPFVAVNLSGRQLATPDLTTIVAKAITVAGIEATRVHLEVTETILVPDIDRSAALLRAIAALGVHISIDDFGTGYSSLNYLQRLPIDTLKVDKSFVDLLGTEGADTSIVSAIINLGRSLGLKVLSEGVESAGQAQQLAALRCQQAQGFYFAKPLPAADFAALLVHSPRLGGLATKSAHTSLV